MIIPNTIMKAVTAVAVWAYGVRAAVTGHWAERWGGGVWVVKWPP